MATEVEKIQRLLEKIGFRQIMEADKDKEWYRAATSPVPCLEEINRIEQSSDSMCVEVGRGIRLE